MISIALATSIMNKRSDERVEIADDLKYLGVNGLSGSLAEWLGAGLTLCAA